MIATNKEKHLWPRYDLGDAYKRCSGEEPQELSAYNGAECARIRYRLRYRTLVCAELIFMVWVTYYTLEWIKAGVVNRTSL